MYSGDNPTALESMEAIADALMVALASDSLPKVTVSEVCAAAGRSRQTFYQLFDSKEDVLAWRFAQLFDEYCAGVPERGSLRATARAYFEFWEGHRAFLDVLAANQLHDLMGTAYEGFLMRMGRFAEAVEEVPGAAYVASGVAGLLASVLLHWRDESYAASADDLAALVAAMLQGGLFGEGLWEPFA